MTLVFFTVFSVMPTSAYAAVTQTVGADGKIVYTTDSDTVWEVGSFDQAAGAVWEFNLGRGNLQVNVNGPQATTWSGFTTIRDGLFSMFNPNGIHFTETSRVNLSNASFIAAAMRAVEGSNLNNFKLKGNGYLLNEGKISGGDVALLGGAVENKGIIEAPLNQITIAGGKAMTVGLSGDNLVSVAVDEATDSSVNDFSGNNLTDQIKNSGNLRANKITLDAKGIDSVFEKAINLTGEIKAVDADINERGELVLMSMDDVYSKAVLEASRIYFESDKNIYLGNEVHVGSIEIAEGTKVYGGDAKITVARDWNNKGEFEGDESEVEFLSDEVSRVLGDNRFHDLTIKTPQKEIFFDAGKTQTVTGEFKVEGAYGEHVKLLSTVEGLHWKFNPLGTYDIAYAWVQDSNNLIGQRIFMHESTNRGNSIGWDPVARFIGASGGLWSNAANWSGLGGATPGAGDDVVFDDNSGAISYIDAGFNGVIGSLLLDYDYGGAIVAQRSLYVTNDNGTSGSMTIRNGTFSTASQTVIEGDLSILALSGSEAQVYGGTGAVFSGTQVRVDGDLIVKGGDGDSGSWASANYVTSSTSSLFFETGQYQDDYNNPYYTDVNDSEGNYLYSLGPFYPQTPVLTEVVVTSNTAHQGATGASGSSGAQASLEVNSLIVLGSVEIESGSGGWGGNGGQGNVAIETENPNSPYYNPPVTYVSATGGAGGVGGNGGSTNFSVNDQMIVSGDFSISASAGFGGAAGEPICNCVVIGGEAYINGGTGGRGGDSGHLNLNLGTSWVAGTTQLYINLAGLSPSMNVGVVVYDGSGVAGNVSVDFVSNGPFYTQAYSSQITQQIIDYDTFSNFLDNPSMRFNINDMATGRIESVEPLQFQIQRRVAIDTFESTESFRSFLRNMSGESLKLVMGSMAENLKFSGRESFRAATLDFLSRFNTLFLESQARGQNQIINLEKGSNDFAVYPLDFGNDDGVDELKKSIFAAEAQMLENRSASDVIQKTGTKIESVAGNARIVSRDGTIYHAQSGAEMAEGDTLVVDSGAEVKLSSGSDEVKVSENTALKVSRNDQPKLDIELNEPPKSLLQLAFGKMSVVVADVEKSQFVVQTPTEVSGLRV